MTRGLGILSLLLAISLGIASARADEEVSKGRADVDAFFRKLDTNHDGRLSRDEFLKIADRFKDRPRARERLSVVYDKLDPQHQGITQQQFQHFLEINRKKTGS